MRYWCVISQIIFASFYLLFTFCVKAYFKLPDWVDNWNDIPEEKDDDPPEVKALKVSSLYG